MGTLALTDAEPEPRGQKHVVENQPGVGREYQVWQPGNRLEQVDRRAQVAQGLIEPLPLPRASWGSVPCCMFIQGLISYSMPK